MPDLALMLAGIIGLGLLCQWLAWRVRLPAILLLLLAGLAVGPGAAWLSAHGHGHGPVIDPDHLFGPLLLPIVSLSVALILFEGGLTLRFAEIRQSGGVIARLISIGALISWALTTLAANVILGFDAGLSVLLGAILVVTGPTVIGPLLRFVRPSGAVAPILRWEGIVIDPIGALLAVLVFEAVSGRAHSAADAALTVLRAVGVGGVIGLASAGLMMVLLRRNGSPEHLHNPLAVAFVLLTLAGANAIEDDAGLLAVTVMGIVLANQKKVDIASILEFKESLGVLLVSSLFILLSARLTPQQLAVVNWRVVLLILTLVLIVRPLAVWASTIRSSLTRSERWFLALMAPRGIVAASVSSVFALRLRDAHVPQAEQLVPVTFAVVAGTVLIYGLTSPLVSRLLGLSKPGQGGIVFIGADALVRTIAEAVHREGYEVLMVDNNPQHVRAARLAGLPAISASTLGDALIETVPLSGLGRVLALTGNEQVNAMASVRLGRHFGRENILAVNTGFKHAKGAPEPERPYAFEAGVTHRYLTDAVAAGATMKATRLSTEFDWAAYRSRYGPRAMPMFVISEKHELHVVNARDTLSVRPGQTVVSLIAAGGAPSVDETKMTEPRA